MRRPSTALFVAACSLATVFAQDKLTNEQMNDAIALGKNGKIPIVRVTSFLGDFEIYISGPIARIASAAAAATQDYRPFDVSNVTDEMKANAYYVRVKRSDIGMREAKRVVLQPKGAKGMEGVIQPIRESEWSATFDRLPDGEFQVVVVTDDRPQKYTVSVKEHAKIQ